MQYLVTIILGLQQMDDSWWYKRFDLHRLMFNERNFLNRFLCKLIWLFIFLFIWHMFQYFCHTLTVKRRIKQSIRSLSKKRKLMKRRKLVFCTVAQLRLHRMCLSQMPQIDACIIVQIWHRYNSTNAKEYYSCWTFSR